jgi:hypothetical protein
MQGMTAGLTKYSCFDCINEEQHLERASERERERERWSRRWSLVQGPIHLLQQFEAILFSCLFCIPFVWMRDLRRMIRTLEPFFSVCVCETRKKRL